MRSEEDAHFMPVADAGEERERGGGEAIRRPGPIRMAAAWRARTFATLRVKNRIVQYFERISKAALVCRKYLIYSQQGRI